jgi:DNA polymerase-3 subunit delta
MKVRDLLYLFHGDNLLIEEAIEEKKERFICGNTSDFNLQVFYAPENSPQEIIESACTLPVLSERRIIIVRESHRFSKDQLGRFIPYLQQPSPTTCLIFVFKELRSTDSFLKEFKKNGKIVRFFQPHERDIPLWIKKRVVKFDKRITDEACQYLLNMVGNNLSDLLNEIEKASLYVGDKALIELNDVQQSVAETPFHSIFHLTRYIGDGDVEKALRALHSLREAGTHPLVVLAMISRHFRFIWMAKEIMDQGGNSESIRKQFKIPISSIRSYIDQTKSISYEQMPRYFNAILSCDLAIKSGYPNEHMLLERLIFDLCCAKR